MKSHLWGILTVLSVCGLAVNVSNAASIGLNIQGGGSAARGTVYPDQNIGVTGSEQINWNNLMPSQVSSAAGVKATYSGPFVDNANAAVPGLELVWTGAGAVNNWTNNNDAASAPVGSGLLNAGKATNSDGVAGNLFLGYAYSSGQPESFRLSGIPYANYDLLVYVGSADFSNLSPVAHVVTTFGATSFDANGLPTDGTATDHGWAKASYLENWTESTFAATGNDAGAGNYFRISGLSDSSMILSFSEATNNFVVHGIQIVEVPEPGSIALLGMGMIGLVGVARRRRNK